MTTQGMTYTTISDVQGPTHTGSGDQTNLWVQLSLIGEAQQRRTATGLWSRYHLDWLERRFVEPAGFGKASAALDERNAVILKGPHGSGRRAAAMMLLRKETPNRSTGTRFRELFPVKAEGDPDWDAADLVEPDDRLLLDLTSADADGRDLVGKGLLEFRGVVETRGAFLAIVADDEPKPSHGAADLDCHITPPGRADVLTRHLDAEGIRDPLGSLLPQPDQLTKLGTWSMSEIERLVKLTCAARESEPAKDAKAWLDSAFKALTDDGTTVAERVAGLETAPQRALLISAAVLSGGTADLSADAAGDLLRILDYPAVSGAALDSPNLVERLNEVGARIDEGRKVRFEEFAQDTSVLSYYWDAFPDLRPHLVEWMDRVIRYETLTSQERDTAVGRYAEQSLRTDRTGDLASLIERWTDGRSGTQRLKLFQNAMTLLDDGLAHERHAHHFRQWIYAWSTKDSPIRADLAAVLIEACLGRLAETHPEQALVRLHHFARRRGDTGELGLDALARFVEEDDRRLRRLLDRIASAGTPNPADARVFLRVADAVRLTADQHRSQPLLDNAYIRDQLTSGWRLALTQFPSGWQDALDRWLWVATAQGQDRGRLLEVLVDAVPDFSTASRLEGAASAWAVATHEGKPMWGPSQRVSVARRLIGELDNRQQSWTHHVTADREHGAPTTPPASEAFQ